MSITGKLPPAIRGALQEAVIGALSDKSPLPHADTRGIVEEVERRLERNPVAVNELNAERPYQSRVAVGSIIALLGPVVGMLGRLMGFDAEYVMEVIGALLTLYGAGLALYGRFKSGLQPLQWGFIGRLLGRASAVILVIGVMALAGAQRSQAALRVSADAFEARMVHAEGYRTAFTAKIATEGGTTTVRFAIAPDRRWIAWFTIAEGLLACPLAVGHGWTLQGEIPAADLRPGLH